MSESSEDSHTTIHTQFVTQSIAIRSVQLPAFDETYQERQLARGTIYSSRLLASHALKGTKT